MSSLGRRVEMLSPHITPSIYKVPKQLRDINMNAYEPEMVAIGPYHHGKPEFQTAEELKLRYFASLLNRKPELKVEYYVAVIKKMEETARDCYAEPPVNLDSATFTDMLVLDGCFIIEVTRSPKHFELSFPVRSSRRILQRDLILLENQIPFFVLCELFDLIEGPEKHISLMKHLLHFCRDVFPGNVIYQATTERASKEVLHVLDLIHSNWFPTELYIPDSRVELSSLGCFPSAITNIPRRIPCASQLKDANVKFCNKKYNSEVSLNMVAELRLCTTLFDVEFNGGKMVMPTLAIEDWTESWLRNLIAYEQFLPRGETTPVADYALLLDSLINTPKDVQILSHKKIIENMLGSDNAVVDIVNRLTERVMLYEESFMYAGTFHKINVHHRKSWNRAVAVFHRDYFSSPWAYIAFLGALLLLLLTVAQTIFTALQQYTPPNSHH